jgi:hypothetical protein
MYVTNKKRVENTNKRQNKGNEERNESIVIRRGK